MRFHDDRRVTEAGMASGNQMSDITRTLARVEKQLEDLMRRMQKTEDDFGLLLSDSRHVSLNGGAVLEGHLQHGELEVRVLQRLSELRTSVDENLGGLRHLQTSEETARKAEVAAVRACLTQGSEDFALIQAQLDEERSRRSADSEELRATVTLCADLASRIQDLECQGGKRAGTEPMLFVSNSASEASELRKEMETLRQEWRLAIDDERQRSAEHARTLGNALGEEFEHSTAARAVAEAKTVALQIVSQEAEQRCTELSQFGTRLASLEAQVTTEIEERQNAMMQQNQRVSETMRSLTQIEATVKDLAIKPHCISREETPRHTGLKKDIEHVKGEVDGWQMQLKSVSDCLESKLRILIEKVEQNLDVQVSTVSGVSGDTSPHISLGVLSPAIPQVGVTSPGVTSPVPPSVGPNTTPGFPVGDSPLGLVASLPSGMPIAEVQTMIPLSSPDVQIRSPSWTPLQAQRQETQLSQPVSVSTPRKISSDSAVPQSQTGIDDVMIPTVSTPRKVVEELDALSALREENMRLREENLDMREERLWEKRHNTQPFGAPLSDSAWAEADPFLLANSSPDAAGTQDYLELRTPNTEITTTGAQKPPNQPVRSISCVTLHTSSLGAPGTAMEKLPHTAGRTESIAETARGGPSPTRQRNPGMQQETSYGVLPTYRRSPSAQVRLIPSPNCSPQLSNQSRTLSPPQQKQQYPSSTPQQYRNASPSHSRDPQLKTTSTAEYTGVGLANYNAVPGRQRERETTSTAATVHGQSLLPNAAGPAVHGQSMIRPSLVATPNMGMRYASSSAQPVLWRSPYG